MSLRILLWCIAINIVVNSPVGSIGLVECRGDTQQEDITNLLIRAKKAEERGDLEEALRLYQIILTRDPSQEVAREAISRLRPQLKIPASSSTGEQDVVNRAERFILHFFIGTPEFRQQNNRFSGTMGLDLRLRTPSPLLFGFILEVRYTFSPIFIEIYGGGVVTEKFSHGFIGAEGGVILFPILHYVYFTCGVAIESQAATGLSTNHTVFFVPGLMVNLKRWGILTKFRWPIVQLAETHADDTAWSLSISVQAKF